MVCATCSPRPTTTLAESVCRQTGLPVGLLDRLADRTIRVVEEFSECRSKVRWSICGRNQLIETLVEVLQPGTPVLVHAPAEEVHTEAEVRTPVASWRYFAILGRCARLVAPVASNACGPDKAGERHDSETTVGLRSSAHGQNPEGSQLSPRWSSSSGSSMSQRSLQSSQR